MEVVEMMAAALNMPLHVVKASMNLLNGIHDASGRFVEGQKHFAPGNPAIEAGQRDAAD